MAHPLRYVLLEICKPAVDRIKRNQHRTAKDKEKPMNISEKSGIEHLTLTITGDLTTAHLSEMQLRLKEALTRTDMLKIDLRSVTSMDLSILQLLCSVHRKASDSQKCIELYIKDSEPFKQIIEVAGFISQWGDFDHRLAGEQKPQRRVDLKKQNKLQPVLN
jgi:ABC-type transporter Mla MlaB component